MGRRASGRPGGSKVRGWTDGSFESLFAPGGPAAEFWIEELFSLENAEPLRTMPGRETLAWQPRSHSAGLVLKRMRGDQAREFWYERLRGQRRRSPARREAENLLGMEACGLPVPRALAWFEDASFGAKARSVVMMERIGHRESLRQSLARCTAAERRRLLHDLAPLVARMHRLGWYHRDLYLQHVILERADEQERMVLIDVGRARNEKSPRQRWFIKDLAALFHSRPTALTQHEALRFLTEYLQARGLGGRSLRRLWIARILAKAQRLAAHAPRHVDPAGGIG